MLLVEKVSYTKGSKTSLDNALLNLWQHLDADFTGDNGEEYLSYKAREHCLIEFGKDMLEHYSDFLYFTDITTFKNDEQYVKAFIKFYKNYCDKFELQLTGIFTDNATTWLVLSAII